MATRTGTHTRDNSLDFARGIAILLVIRAHSPLSRPPDAFSRVLDWPAHHMGWAGVDLFFVLSGFLIGGLLMRESIETGTLDVKRFLIRRGFKIWPAYLVYIVLAGAVVGRSLTAVIPNFVHLQNYLGTPLRHTWSLAVEEHFYIGLVAALAWMTKRRPLDFASVARLCGAVFAFCLAARIYGVWSGQTDVQIQWQTHTRVDTLMLGILLAALYRYQPERFAQLGGQRVMLTLGVFVAPIFLVAFPTGTAVFETIGYDVVAVSAASLLVLLFTARPGSGLLGKARTTLPYRLIAWIGFYSYGIYLWHNTGVRGAAFLSARMPNVNQTVAWYVCMVAYLTIAIVVGSLMTKAVELPFLKLRDRKVPAKDVRLAYEPSATTEN